METLKSLASKIYTVNDQSFANIALATFRFQVANNPVYKAFIEHLRLSVEHINSVDQIPFLPVSFFKTHTLKTGQWAPEATFRSSGTTKSTLSSHFIPSLKFYLNNSQKCFEHFFGAVSNYHFLALLPSYMERGASSSLITMIDHFIQNSNSEHSSFYLTDYERLARKLEELKSDSRRTILWGVSFALLDFAEQYSIDLSHCMVFETGGMKGRRKEITRFELQGEMKKRLNVELLYSEYGMTELLSQAYSKGDLRFHCPPWMQIMSRDLTDPFQKGLLSETGGINVIDLANWHTISFIETEDLGKAYADGSFEVLGRLDNSDVRGCNLMIQ